jgi:hypothetical protein
MGVQIDRFGDNGWAVLLSHPDGVRSFDAPRGLLPEAIAAEDVFEVRFEQYREETEWIGRESRRLSGELLGDER